VGLAGDRVGGLGLPADDHRPVGQDEGRAGAGAVVGFRLGGGAVLGALTRAATAAVKPSSQLRRQARWLVMRAGTAAAVRPWAIWQLTLRMPSGRLCLRRRLPSVRGAACIRACWGMAAPGRLQ
jgi:hypothetical protein